ncbi:tripartite tricarboxylate transporter TctB family protein [Hydrogenophaga sp. OTU3427]|uniref:tripartite tricarboxylate transporter TctB family protein n=1 Tax=Hydrogenophaga sp. OTU3427 TaxID=3043856 RepID=UPI00313A7926
MSQAPNRPQPASLPEVLIGVGVLALAAFLAWGATGISSEAGYAGVGPNFLPWMVSAALAICGVWLLWEARSGGYRSREAPSGAERGDWPAFAWVSVGVLANAALITTLGFVVSCALCFVLAVRGLRIAEGKPGGGLHQTLKDAAVGLLISAPVYWLFTKILAVNLPGLTATGWL